jgi:hypothetical protein
MQGMDIKPSNKLQVILNVMGKVCLPYPTVFITPEGTHCTAFNQLTSSKTS